jgi:hypothetical protein
MRQPRIRLRELKADAAQTMAEARTTLANSNRVLSQADKSLLVLTEKAMQALGVFIEAVEEVLDGTEIEAEVMGQKIPVKIRIVPREEAESDG